MRGEFFVPVYFDYFATFAWAFSGAVVGFRRGYDIVGVFLIALVSSTGGGLIRDGFLLQKTPALLTNSVYLVLIAVATALVGIISKSLVSVLRPGWLDKFIELIDAVGMPAFAIVGMQMALEQKVSIPGVILVGVINGVGGGLLRDVLARETPRLLLPGQYSSLVLLIACMTYLGLRFGPGITPLGFWSGPALSATEAALVTIVLFFVVRALTVRFNWTSAALLREPPK